MHSNSKIKGDCRHGVEVLRNFDTELLWPSLIRVVSGPLFLVHSRIKLRYGFLLLPYWIFHVKICVFSISLNSALHYTLYTF